MLNIKQELQKYIEPESSSPSQGELPTVLEVFAQEVKRFGKEQYKTTSQLEELLIQMEEQAEGDNAKQVLEQQLKNTSEEKSQLLLALLTSADALEEVYRFAQKNATDDWQKQLALQWERLGKALMFCGLMRIEGIGDPYQPQTQVATGVSSDPTLPEEVVLTIIKSGYVYRGQLLRKAEVIVNKPQPFQPKVAPPQNVPSEQIDIFLD